MILYDPTEVGWILAVLESLLKSNSLKKLSFEHCDVANSRFSAGKALSAMVQQNEALVSIPGLEHLGLKAELVNEVEFHLKVNQWGRRAVQSQKIPLGFWPEIMSSKADDASVLFYLLRRKPELLSKGEARGIRRERSS